MRKRVSPGQFANDIRRIAKRFPDAVQAGMREGAQLLKGALVQNAIAATDPYQPVDRAAYKGGWRSNDVAGGAVVFNIAKQAIWIERGRAPGPVPVSVIAAWVKRKGLYRDVAKSAKSKAGQDAITHIAWAISKKLGAKGYAPRWVLRRAVEALRAPMREILDRHVKAVQP